MNKTIHIALNNNYMNNNMTFLYPSVEYATSISIRRIISSEVLPVKELLISSDKPNRFYQVIDHKAGDLVICIDQQCDIVSLHVNDVRVVNGYQ
jgi:hypothetical protein